MAKQGDSVCVSPHKTDVAVAQCQAFCAAKFKKFQYVPRASNRETASVVVAAIHHCR